MVHSRLTFTSKCIMLVANHFTTMNLVHPLIHLMILQTSREIQLDIPLNLGSPILLLEVANSDLLGLSQAWIGFFFHSSLQFSWVYGNCKPDSPSALPIPLYWQLASVGALALCCIKWQPYLPDRMVWKVHSGISKIFSLMPDPWSELVDSKIELKEIPPIGIHVCILTLWSSKALMSWKMDCIHSCNIQHMLNSTRAVQIHEDSDIND